MAVDFFPATSVKGYIKKINYVGISKKKKLKE
jgi:hypothetical protein